MNHNNISKEILWAACIIFICVITGFFLFINQYHKNYVPSSADIVSISTNAEIIITDASDDTDLKSSNSHEEIPYNCPIDFESLHKTNKDVYAWISIPGRVKAVHGLSKEQNLAVPCEGVQDVLVRSQPGDSVSFPRNNVEKCGNIIAVDSTWQGAATKAQAAVKTILLELEPCQRVTDDFFDLPLPQLRQPCQRGQAAHEESFPPAAFILPPPLEQELAQYLSSNKEAFDATRSLLQQLPPWILWLYLPCVSVPARGSARGRQSLRG